MHEQRGTDGRAVRHEGRFRRMISRITSSYEELEAEELLQDTQDVGGGKLIASVKDADGNLIGLTQEPSA
jgi:hypothetical protein